MSVFYWKWIDYISIIKKDKYNNILDNIYCLICIYNCFFFLNEKSMKIQKKIIAK